MKNLYLFDIDGTLVNINNVHLQSYKLDYLQVLKRDIPDETILRTFGMSEADMHSFIFNELSISYNNNLIKKLIKVHAPNFNRAIGTADVKPLEGVVEFLSQLKNDNQYMSVITGNIEAPARLILERARLTHFFDYISFDDGNSKREQIVQRAIDEAKQHKYDFNRVVVIGDTVHDIKAGKYVKAFTVGVGTGSDSLGKLKAQNPDILLSNLTQYKKIMEKVR